MKKIIQLVIVLVILVSAFSCKQHSDKKETPSKIEKTEEHQEESEAVLKLDNGNLWSANTETTDGIKNMITLMNAFTEDENLEAYATLKQNLEKEFGAIISKCTMEGEAHNQLHNYLIPMKDLFNGLGSSDINTCKENYNTLNKHLLAYSNYFK